ncbi:MAG: manganese efflux pump [Bacilli bacterium]|nr:manganese efflux pump [Bacilli bacterium]
MQIITTIIIAISLSMDAFSLSIAYGTLNLNKKEISLLSIIVGIYHFIMPQIGHQIGIKILQILPLEPEIIVFLVLFLIGLQMILETIKEEKNIKKMNIKEMLIFGFAVSIDSFSVGIGLETICNNIILSSLLFSISSFLFTNIGLKLGTKINEYVGKISTLMGGIILMIIGLLYII